MKRTNPYREEHSEDSVNRFEALTERIAAKVARNMLLGFEKVVEKTVTDALLKDRQQDSIGLRNDYSSGSVSSLSRSESSTPSKNELSAEEKMFDEVYLHPTEKNMKKVDDLISNVNSYKTLLSQTNLSKDFQFLKTLK